MARSGRALRRSTRGPGTGAGPPGTKASGSRPSINTSHQPEYWRMIDDEELEPPTSWSQYRALVGAPASSSTVARSAAANALKGDPVASSVRSFSSRTLASSVRPGIKARAFQCSRHRTSSPRSSRAPRSRWTSKSPSSPGRGSCTFSSRNSARRIKAAQEVS